ncbi:hypothetical protein BVRB_3g069480 [Beta vulgaris subsp. vulgaris]|nr:hypothetical protein BVRB_3g069480 [Beta vulgaris subsp. vulgaris]
MTHQPLSSRVATTGGPPDASRNILGRSHRRISHFSSSFFSSLYSNLFRTICRRSGVLLR